MCVCVVAKSCKCAAGKIISPLSCHCLHLVMPLYAVQPLHYIEHATLKIVNWCDAKSSTQCTACVMILMNI